MSLAISSKAEPLFEPGKMRFMSRSNAGMPRVTESMPMGFSAG